MNQPIKKYLLKKSLHHKWSLNSKPNQKTYSFIISIPSYAEHNYIRKTLNSISNQNNLLLKKTLIIIVINNKINDENKILNSNLKTIELIKLFKNLNIHYVDAFSYNNALPTKQAGVGLARKIGFDIGLKFSNENTIFCSLDADTIISEKYLLEIKKFYNNKNTTSAVINFKHIRSSSSILNKSIKLYEEFIKTTSLHLKKANSPYYYHSIGSTITCTAHAYASVGGMSKRKATEDFYFLESLAKYKKVKTINEILVYPSSRISNRVYLGTGFRMEQSSKGYDLKELFFKKQSFLILSKWLKLGKKSMNVKIDTLLLKANIINENLPNFLNEQKIKRIWDGLQKSSPSNKHFEKQFHRWFDALKTIKLLKYFSN
ncbi:MAG: hypothetical protein CMG07_02245 [Candidatus Marinimicrobia bacterium]|nr:hypothetical protein [Candidatus Neomarinimicrobiota bacterium]